LRIRPDDDHDSRVVIRAAIGIAAAREAGIIVGDGKRTDFVGATGGADRCSPTMQR
jgi:hypothetical protein